MAPPYSYFLLWPLKKEKSNFVLFWRHDSKKNYISSFCYLLVYYGGGSTERVVKHQEAQL